MLRRRPVLVPLAVMFTLLLAFAIAAEDEGENPFDELWEAVGDLQDQIGDLQDQIDDLPTSTPPAPAGTIVMWSGSLSSIPNGWALCDGTQGTPDLMDRFILGVSDNENPGGSGGAESHSHAGGAHSHGAPSHIHTFSLGSSTHTNSSGSGHSHSTGDASGDPVVVAAADDGTVIAGRQHSHDTTTGGEHLHTLAVFDHPTDSASGGSTESASAATQSSDHLPPYFKLAFIMKL